METVDIYLIGLLITAIVFLCVYCVFYKIRPEYVLFYCAGVALVVLVYYKYASEYIYPTLQYETKFGDIDEWVYVIPVEKCTGSLENSFGVPVVDINSVVVYNWIGDVALKCVLCTKPGKCRYLYSR